jgi:hypothetical protein
MASAPSIPAAQASALQALAAQGKLSGVNPVALEVIDKEESGGEGGGINPEGYGGFFGLGESSTYPGGTTSPSLLRDTSSSGFDTQAEIAASAFAAYLTQASGDPVNAEQIYQTGQPISASNPEGGGAKLMAQYLGTPGSAGGGATTGTTSAQSQATPTNAITTGLGSDIVGALWPAGLSQLFIRAGLIFFGGVLVIVALIIAAHAASPGAREAAASEEETKSATTENKAETEEARSSSSSSPSPVSRAPATQRAAPPQPASGAKLPAFRSHRGGSSSTAVSGSNLAKTGEEAAEVAA